MADEMKAARTVLVGAAQAFRAGRDRILPQPEKWQDDAWEFYDELGEFRFGVMWLAGALSRVRLLAATRPLEPGDEPSPVVSGGPATFVAELAGGVGGQAQVLDTLTTYLSVPGEGWIIGETLPDGTRRWEVRSSDELKASAGGVEVIDDVAVMTSRRRWRRVAKDSLVVRVWRPHKRFRHLADSPARAALNIMRELELTNRHITARLLSRIASAGVLILPEEATLLTQQTEQEGEAPDFITEWVEAARSAISEPGTASAVVPIPVQVPGEFVDKIRFIDFDVPLDERIMEQRESAIRRLATALDLPAEVLLGVGDLNHWSAWQVEESAIKVHIAPVAEIICHCLTIGFLRPMLVAAGLTGEEADDYIVWYDTTELTARPDHSESATAAYDRIELSGTAFRRELGFDESDAPTGADLVAIVLRKLLTDPTLGGVALEHLTGIEVPAEPTVIAQPAVPSPNDEAPTPAESPAEGPPPAPRSTAPVGATLDVSPGRNMVRAEDGWYFVDGTGRDKITDPGVTVLDGIWLRKQVHRRS